MKLGGSLTGSTVIVNCWVGLSSSPPLAVPPSSVTVTVIVALPLASAAGVKPRLPVVPSIAGSDENRSGFVLSVTTKVRVCPLSLAAPGSRSVAHGWS